MTTLVLHSARGSRHLLREESDETRPQYEVGEGTGSHVTVFTKEAVEGLDLKKGDVVLDATLGEGGHSQAILTTAPVTLIALDADPRAIAYAQKRLSSFGSRVKIFNANFADAAQVLQKEGIASINKALFDLGWNRGQLLSGRGFSFLQDEPLVMSYGPIPASGFSAAEILNTWSEKALADVFYGYGEERYARRIAHAVVETRKAKSFATTSDLIAVLEASLPAVYRRGRLHFATRTFQALRIAVNDELGVLERGLRGVWDMLAPQGRIAVITFHSIEDRVVKQFFAALAKEEGAVRITKKPISPSQEELLDNPSARSAKLRIIQKA